MDGRGLGENGPAWVRFEEKYSREMEFEMAKDMRKRDMTGMDGKRNGEGFRRKEAVGGGAKTAKRGGNGG